MLRPTLALGRVGYTLGLDALARGGEELRSGFPLAVPRTPPSLPLPICGSVSGNLPGDTRPGQRSRPPISTLEAWSLFSRGPSLPFGRSSFRRRSFNSCAAPSLGRARSSACGRLDASRTSSGLQGLGPRTALAHAPRLIRAMGNPSFAFSVAPPAIPLTMRVPAPALITRSRSSAAPRHGRPSASCRHGPCLPRTAAWTPAPSAGLASSAPTRSPA